MSSSLGNERDQIKAPMSAKAGRETDCNAGGAFDIVRFLDVKCSLVIDSFHSDSIELHLPTLRNFYDQFRSIVRTGGYILDLP